MSSLSIEIPLLVVLCILYTLASFAIHEYKNIYQVPPWCHESSIATLLGILIGAILKIFWNQTIIFDNEIFFYFVLPPIIFSAGYTLKRRNFFRYFHLISLFGIIGTILQFVLIALLSSLFAYYFLDPLSAEDHIFTWKDGILLAAILSGSDEVSAMSLVRMKDFPRMGALIFGEGVLNDALSIVLFKVLSGWIVKTSEDSSVGISSGFILSLCETVLLEILFSCLIGLCCGLVHARLLILLPTLRSHPVHQTTLIILFGYISYALAELSGHASSILTLFIAAVTLAHYSYYSLSKTAQLTTQIAFKSFAEISEAFSFSYLGLSVFSLTFTHYRLLYSFSLLFSLILVRLVTILFLFAIIRTGIPLREQIGFSLGGMVRGSLCWAQVQYIHNTAHPVLITTILVVVMSTTVGSGIILPIIMPWLTEGLGEGRSEGKTKIARRVTDPRILRECEDKEEERLSLTQWTLDNQYPDATSQQLLSEEERDEDQESTYTTHLNNSVEDSLSVDHSTPNSLPPHLNSSHSFLHALQPISSSASSCVSFGRYLYILWVRFDETIMKPLFGGSSADSSRLFLLRSTRSLTAYSLLSEQSKREEVDEILMKSGELNAILEAAAAEGAEGCGMEWNEEDEVFSGSVRSRSRDQNLNQTAFDMSLPQRRFLSPLGRPERSLSPPLSLSPITPFETPSRRPHFMTPPDDSCYRYSTPCSPPATSGASPRHSSRSQAHISPIPSHPIHTLASPSSRNRRTFITEQTGLLSGTKVVRKRTALESITGQKLQGRHSNLDSKPVTRISSTSYQTLTSADSASRNTRDHDPAVADSTGKEEGQESV